MKTKMKLACVLLTLVASVAAQKCEDENENCWRWKRNCDWDPFVARWCKKTCGTCGPTPAPTQGPPHPAGCGCPQVAGVRVVAGEDAQRGAWPWQILMIKNGRAGCGGTLISNRWVVTAAHCVDGADYRTRFQVRVGEHDRKATEGSERDIEVERIIKHPSYISRLLQNDIALFKLSKPVMFGKYVQPVCLPTGDVAPGTDCYITGWGKSKHTGGMHSYLQQAKMPVVSNRVCNAKNFWSIGIAVTSDMICAGDAGITKKSGCHGDSGGPFVCKVRGVWELHGDVSHGSSRCSSVESYSVFARTTHFKSWIEQTMKKYA